MGAKLNVFGNQSGSFQDFVSPSKLSIQVGVFGRCVTYRNHAKSSSSSKFVLMETEATGLHFRADHKWSG